MSNSDAKFFPGVGPLRPDSMVTELLAGARDKIPSRELIWWCLVGCIVLGNIRIHFGDQLGPFYYLTVIGGSAGCAWLWLFARTLFQRDVALTKWPLFLLSMTVLIEGTWEVTHGLATIGISGEMRRIISNGASFICISMLALVFVEAMSGFNQQLAKVERRFRLLFSGFLGLALSVTILWTMGAPEGSLALHSQKYVYLAFGLLTIVGGRIAIAFRRENPLSKTCLAQTSSVRRKPDQACVALANRIRHALEHEQFYTTPKLRVADLSKALGEPEYKVTQCITGTMEYQNFNRLVNAYRVATAKDALSKSEENNRQILSIALECGFNSIGPFNRAFKQEVGMTPRQYRANQNV